MVVPPLNCFLRCQLDIGLLSGINYKRNHERMLAKKDLVLSNKFKQQTKDIYMNQQEIEALVKDGMIISNSIIEHFAEIVTSMEAIGAQRRGSRPIRDELGRNLIADVYVLPNGRTILAGYQNPF